MLGPVVDLADYAGRLFDVADAELQTITADVAASQVIVVASSTYKATYTGLLKAFFDRYGADGLRGSVAVPVMVGASAVHSLAPEVFLRPLLVELGASVPTRSLYVIESQLAELDMVVTAWTALASPLLASVVSVDSPRSD
jgi:FMN reductase